MGDADNTVPPTKKRCAEREITKDNPGLDDDEETSELESGTFKKASDDVIASRRIVKVRRQPKPSTPSSNPFAGIQLIPSADLKTAKPETEKKVSEADDENNNNAKEETDESNDVAETKEIKAEVDEVPTEAVRKEETVDEETEVVVEKVEAEDQKVIEEKSAENKDEKDNGDESIEKTEETASFSSFQQLSSTQNAFTGIVGTGFSSSSFSLGVSKDGSSASCGSGFAFSFAKNNGSSLFGTEGGSTGTKNERVGLPSMQEVTVETGEEDEKAVFTADSVLFEFLDGGWRERGKGELKVNVPTAGGTRKARLVMRTKGNYRLVLNASLYPDMKLTKMDKKGVTFACINSGGEGKEGLSTFALKFKDVSIVEEFRSVVDEHKDGPPTAVMKTPENSPKASDE